MTGPQKSQGRGPSERRGDACAIVIFGASGDLTKRKLLPALYNLRSFGLLAEKYAVVGVALDPLNDETTRAQMSENIKKFATGSVDADTWNEFQSRAYYVSGQFTDPQLFERLKQKLAEVEQMHGTGGNVLFYLAIPPQCFLEVIRGLGASGLATEADKVWRRVIIEKPFGSDLESAQKLNLEIAQVLRERQIYRIDHYLGKETVQNLLVFRFGNGIWEPTWNRRYIDNVQITVAETVGVEERGAYYDTAGAVRDVIQNHMFMLLALVAMEPPSSFKADALRNEKVKVFEAMKIMSPEEVLLNTVRGQYDGGTVEGKTVAPYRQEPRVAPNSATETYAALKLYVDNWRWAGVPFYLRSGKALAERSTYITVHFRKAPMQMFDRLDRLGSNRLVIYIQPTEGIELDIRAKIPGPAIHTKDVKLNFSYQDFGPLTPVTGYERLLYDCMIGDPSLFHRTDMVEAAWRVATPILDVWKTLPARDFPNYEAGSWGPAAADTLVEHDGFEWYYPGQKSD